MGTSSMVGSCGCTKTRLLEPKEDIWITWAVCATHYNPEVDDKMIAEAAKNNREYEAAIRKYEIHQS